MRGTLRITDGLGLPGRAELIAQRTPVLAQCHSCKGADLNNQIVDRVEASEALDKLICVMKAIFQGQHIPGRTLGASASSSTNKLPSTSIK